MSRWQVTVESIPEDEVIPEDLEINLADYGVTLRPDFAVRELEPLEDGPSWQLLVKVLEDGLI